MTTTTKTTPKHAARPAPDAFTDFAIAPLKTDSETLEELRELWRDAMGRGLIAGEYYDAEDVRDIAQNLGLPITRHRAKGAVQLLAQQSLTSGCAVDHDAVEAVVMEVSA